jgi:DUF4097 and DUF4098 domain-containing protein YvlB
MKRILLATVLLTCCGAPLTASMEIRESRPASPRGEVTVEVPFGSVEVVGWDKNEVLVEGEVGPGVESVDVDAGGGDVSIEVEIRGGGQSRMGADLVIRVPRGAELAVEGIHTTVVVRELRGGSLEVESVSGNVAVSGDLQVVDVETISGNVDVTGTVGAVQVESASGSVTVDGVDGEFEIESISGSVTIRGGTLTGGQVATASGNVRVEGELARSGKIEIETLSGEVWIVVPENVSAEFEIETFSGKIRSDFAAEASSSSRHASKYLSFSTGGGGFRVNVDTFSGRCEIRKR